MNIVDIINKKRKKQVLTSEEITFVIKDYVDHKIPDYQMSALLMAITLNGMTEQETVDLTTAMLNSGHKIDLRMIPGIKVDKHSTGGVGDKTTLILAPIVAATGVNVAKMSGRGLGFTGGTIDKLESIPGFKTSLTLHQFTKQVSDIHIAVISGSKDLVQADKMMYALRDVTGTVESIPLIAASIMSKKLASGTDKLVIDVKVGNGALMKTLEDAKALAHLMVHIGKMHQKETVCILTNMNQPLGSAIGNALEVQESMDVLQGKGPADITGLAITFAIQMVKLGKNISEQEQKWTEKKQTMEEDVRKECKESVGFLEELEAMWSIITTRPLAGIFYGVFFLLLMSLELFVVVSKTVDKECDYETAIKGAQKVRIAQLSSAFNKAEYRQVI